MLTGLPDLSSKRKERTLLTAVPNPNHTLWLYTAQAVPDPTKLDMPLSPAASHPSVHRAQSPKFGSGSKQLPNQMYLFAGLGIFPTPTATRPGVPQMSLPSSPVSSWKGLASPWSGSSATIYQPTTPLLRTKHQHVPGISLQELSLCSPFCLCSLMSLPTPLAFRGVSNLALSLPRGLHLCI